MADHPDRAEARLAAELGPTLVRRDELVGYDRDSSVFRLEPLAGVRPRTEDDIRRALSAAARLRIPVVARAGGSNTGGAAITDGLLLLFDRGTFDDVAVDPTTGLATCGPGVRHDRIQHALGTIGRWLPSDPSSGPLSYVGGNVATRASGPHALRHGAINRYVREVRFVAADGAVIDTRAPGSIPASLTDRLAELATRVAADLESVARLESRRDAKWASGYELLALVDHAADPVSALPRLLTGSVGTLGIVTEVALQGVAKPDERAATLIRFRSSHDACLAAAELRRAAAAIEIVNRRALEILREHSDVLGGDETSAAMLIVEYDGAGAVDRAVAAGEAIAARFALGAAPETASDEASIQRIWRARKALLPVIRRLAGERGAPYSIVNDVGVVPDRLSDLLAGAEAIFDRHGIVAPIYGHAGSGNLHLRPLFRRGDLRTVVAIADETYRLVTGLGGTITAEHGMGRLRSPFLELEWGAPIVGYMRELKSIFDPNGILNPGVVFADAHRFAGTRPPGGARPFAEAGWPEPPVLD